MLKATNGRSRNIEADWDGFIKYVVRAYQDNVGINLVDIQDDDPYSYDYGHILGAPRRDMVRSKMVEILETLVKYQAIFEICLAFDAEVRRKVVQEVWGRNQTRR